MPLKKIVSQEDVARLQKFFLQNPTINLRKISLKNEEVVNQFTWDELTRYKKKILSNLQSYQRLLKLLPYDDRNLILELLQDEIYSALQVAAIPRDKFVDKYAHLFANDLERIDLFLGNAKAVKTRLLLQFMGTQK